MSGLVFIGVLVLPALVYWLHWRWTHRRLLRLAALVPGPPALPVIGNALLFMVNPKELLNKFALLYEQHGEYSKFWLGPQLNIMVKNPNDIRKLLTSNKVNQKGPTYDMMLPYIGPGLLTGGPTWRNHRKIATPSYSKKAIEHYTVIFNLEAEQLARNLCLKDSTLTFDLFKDVVQTTTQCTNQSILGLSKEDSEKLYRLDELLDNMAELYELIFAKMTKWWLQIPLIFWLVGGKKSQELLVKLVDDFVSDVVRKRRKALEKGATPEESMGIVDRFILSGDMSQQEIKWETFTIFTTSQEPPAKISSGILLFLAHLPHWQDKVYEEILQVLGPDGAVTGEQLKQLQYLDMVYQEALRYLTIAPLIQRTVEEEITVNEGKYTLPAGSSLVIPMHHLHRDPRYWEDPNKMMPERFLPENAKKLDPNAFIPFGLGSMSCMGRLYASTLIKTIVVWVLRRVSLETDVAPEDLTLNLAISVSFADGYNVRVKPR